MTSATESNLDGNTVRETDSNLIDVLRRFHYGEPAAAKQTRLPGENTLPALLNPYRDASAIRYQYPLYLFPPGDTTLLAQPLGEFLSTSIDEFALGPDDARILRDNLPWIERSIDWLKLLLLVLALVVPPVVARRNLRRGTGDRRLGVRFGFVVWLWSLASWMLFADHTSRWYSEIEMFITALAFSLPPLASSSTSWNASNMSRVCLSSSAAWAPSSASVSRPIRVSML